MCIENIQNNWIRCYVDEANAAQKIVDRLRSIVGPLEKKEAKQERKVRYKIDYLHKYIALAKQVVLEGAKKTASKQDVEPEVSTDV